MRSLPRFLLAAVVIIVLAHLADRWAYVHLAQPGVYDHDLGRMLRSVGYLPLWLLLASALWLQQRDTKRALLLALVPAAGGLLAEVLKILVRRERPSLHDGAYVFRSFHEGFWKTTAIGMPSSHMLVATCGCWVLYRWYPRAWIVWLLLALGCGLTRVEAQAHFLSDVAVAAVVGVVVAEICVRRGGPSLRSG